MSLWYVVFKKELLETLRDRRTLMMMVAVPILLYPVLMIAAQQLTLLGMRRLESEPAPIGLIGAVDRDLRGFLESHEDLRLVPITDPLEAIRSDSASAVAVFEADDGSEASRSVRILYSAAKERSQRGRTVLRSRLTAWSDTLLSRRLDLHGLPVGFAQPLAVGDSSVARAEEVGGYALGRFLPLLLILMTLLGTFYPAIDLAAGEKERGTLETLLTAPVPPRDVVIGKFATVALIGVIAAALNLASMMLTFQSGLFSLGGALDIEFSLPLSAVALVFLTLLPLSVLFGSLFLGVAVRSRSFKEAQNALTPIYLLVMLPALLPVFPGIEFTPALAIVPVAGIGLFFRELMAGSAPLVPSLLAAGSTVAWAALALGFASASFGREEVLFGADEPAAESGAPLIARLRAFLGEERVPTPAQALLFLAAVAAVFFYAGFPLQARLGERGLLLSEWLLLLGPVLLFVGLSGHDVVETLSLRRPNPRGVGAALLVIAGGMPLGWFLAWAQSFVLPIPWELLEGLEDLLTATDPARFVWLFFLLAVTPALCEEAVFRGVFLSGTRGAARRVLPVVLLNGVAFGAFHLSFETAFRFLPTAWLGVLLATVALRTRSIWTSVLMHMLNNGMIVVAASVPLVRSWLGDGDRPPPWWILPLAAAALIVGLRLLPTAGAADVHERA